VRKSPHPSAAAIESDETHRPSLNAQLQLKPRRRNDRRGQPAFYKTVSPSSIIRPIMSNFLRLTRLSQNA
jgi:hypothetical protein